MAKKKPHIPTRRCIACYAHLEKNSFFRIVKLHLGKDEPACATKIFFDKTLKSPGRGAYICKKKECLQIAKKKRSLARAFRCKVDDKILDELEQSV